MHWDLVNRGLAYNRNHPSIIHLSWFFSVLLPLPKTSSYFWLSLWFPPERIRTGLSHSQRNLTIYLLPTLLNYGKKNCLIEFSESGNFLTNINQRHQGVAASRDFSRAKGTGGCGALHTRTTVSHFWNPWDFLRLLLLSSNRGDPRTQLQADLGETN